MLINIFYSIEKGRCGFNETASLTEKNFTSPNWPRNYPDRIKCEWFFSTDANARIRIDIRNFTTEERYDMLVGIYVVNSMQF